MLIYLTGSGGNKEYIETQQIPFNPPRLFSYFLLVTNTMTYGEMKRFEDLLSHITGRGYMPTKISVFLDSGAYSASTKNVTINLAEYIQFIKENLLFLIFQYHLQQY